MEITLSIIPHKLTWMSAKFPPGGRVLNSDLVFSIQEYAYTPFQSEIGPIDLCSTIHFCKTLEKMLSEGPTVHYCSVKSAEKSNGAYLMCAFIVLVLKQTPQQAWENFQNLPVLFLSYRDITPGLCSYKCSILHCIQVLYKATKIGWIKYAEFNVDRHRDTYSLEKGDISWIVPNKIAVFSSPCSEPRDFTGVRNYTPEDYSAIFSRIGVRTVIRLDGYPYDPERFLRNRMRFYDFSFKGSTPPNNVIHAFLEIAESSDFGVAIHCKAGMGKSPTLASLYVMKKFDITAEEYIAWARICRPGSIISEQQDFIIQMESKCKSIKRKEEKSTKLTISADNFLQRTGILGSTSTPLLEIRGSMKLFTRTSLSSATTRPSSKKKNDTLPKKIFAKRVTFY